MDRDSKIILRKLVMDFCCLFVVGMSVLMFYLFGKPYKRGFFCEDESLHYPSEESTVTSPMLYLTGLFLPICVIIIGEYLFYKNCSGQSSRMFFGYAVPPWVWSAYSKIGVFGFGAASTTLTTDIAKYTIGRLRPHFMAVCQPSVDCTLASNLHVYITNFSCTATNVDAKMLKEVRLSFPSGHSSFSAYTMVYLALYLQLRVTWKGSKLIKHLLQFMCLLMAWFTAMTRVSDYKHHWSDVLAGSTLGVLVAVIVANCIADLFKDREEIPSSTDKVRKPADYDPEGTQVNNGIANHIC